MVSKEGVKSRPCHVNQGPFETSFCPFVKTADERIIRAALAKRRLVDDFIEAFNAISSEERQAKLEAFLMGIEEDSYLKATKGDNGPVLEARIAEAWSFVSEKGKLALLRRGPCGSPAPSPRTEEKTPNALPKLSISFSPSVPLAAGKKRGSWRHRSLNAPTKSAPGKEIDRPLLPKPPKPLVSAFRFVSSKKKLSLRLLKRARTLESSVFTAEE